MFNYCRLYCGASLGMVRSILLIPRCRIAPKPGSQPDLCQLVGRSSPREEGGSLWILLHERHCASDSGAVEVEIANGTVS